MGAGALECGLGNALKQRVVLGAEVAEGFERLLGLAPRVVQVHGPQFLVEPGHDGIVLGQHLADAVRGHDLGIREVGGDLADAPSAGRDEKIFFVAEDAGQRHGDDLGTAAESFQ